MSVFSASLATLQESGRDFLLGGGSLGAPKMAGTRRWGWPWRDVLGDDAVAVAHDAAAADFEDCR